MNKARTKPIFGVWSAPLEYLYACVTLLRRWLYDKGWLSHYEPSLMTISVGGLEAGGSGKTPVTAFLLKKLMANSRYPGLLSRGYGRKSKGLFVRMPGDEVRPEQMGDEPAMLVTNGLDLPVAVCAKRSVGAMALTNNGVDTLVLDDGFAHRALRRHVDIVVLRGEAPLGNGHLLPRGSLREPRSSLRRAHILWFHFKNGVVHELPDWVAREFPQTPTVVSRALVGKVRGESGEEVGLENIKVVAATGIARPDDFFESLGTVGADITESIAFRDHHYFTEKDVQSLRSIKEQSGARFIAVTAKDWIKLKNYSQGDEFVRLEIEIEIVVGHQILQRLYTESEAMF